MKDYVKRMIDEARELFDRITEVKNFLQNKNSSLDGLDKEYLCQQYCAMSNYFFFLKERLFRCTLKGDIDKIDFDNFIKEL